MSGLGEVWMWNVDPVWSHHASMIKESILSTESCDDFSRHHHLMGCLYFGIGVIESFLNKMMRNVMENELTSEDEIFKHLRKTSFNVKKMKWPSVICGREVHIPDMYMSTIDSCNVLRGEITHPKRRDHSIYRDLEEVGPAAFAEAVTCFIVYIYQEKEEVFPYWLLGWNCVGMNGDVACMELSNNLNGFVWSLARMGLLEVPAGGHLSEIWEKEYMTSISGYSAIKSRLDSYPEDIEPFNSIGNIPFPRLTKRWWDRNYILSKTPDAFRSRRVFS
ncbi:hypothetical protein [Desulfocurvus vexinensis]|uniref:hypothetical protein n=1 Tax=Desulfocurvus vexinensis TaxID=399548 RepID=UPI0012EBCEB3|nr:hypothetical protein [Desulfocurvus vexinensis]